jgi:hypothetical protein
VKPLRLFSSLAVLALVACHRPAPVERPEPPAVLNKPEARLQLETARYCERALANTRVTVVAQEVPISESNERGIRSLTFSDGGRAHAKRGTAVLGTTEAAFSLVMDSRLNTQVAPASGQSCSRLDLAVVVSMLHHTVNVAREFKPGTCAYDKIREHEYQHVAINNAALHEAASALQSEMRQFFGNKIFYGDPTALLGQLRAALDNHWVPRLQQLKEEVLSEHDDVDSVDEYASNQTDCDGEIPEVLRGDPRLRDLFARKP